MRFLLRGVPLSATFSLRCVAAPIPDVFARKSDQNGHFRHGMGTARAFQCAASQTSASPARRSGRAFARWRRRGAAWAGAPLRRADHRLERARPIVDTGCPLARPFCLLPALGRLTVGFASFLWWRLPELVVAFRRVILLICLALLGLAVYLESRTSYLEALLFSHLNSGMNVALQPGPSESIRFPKSGPYDERLGYSAMPDFIASLTERRYAVDNAARWSPRLASFVHEAAFPIYPEKDQAGLRIVDRNGERLYGAQFPERTFKSFAAIPPVLVKTLLFIEDRYLLDQSYPERNPAIEWDRFALAAAGR